jgi:hypothetical protein
MADIDYDRLSEAIADAISRRDTDQSNAKAEEILRKQNAEAVKALSQLTKSLKETSSASKVVDRWMRNQSSAYNSLQDEIKELEDQINDTKNAGLQKTLREQRDVLTTAQNLQNLNAAIENASLGFAKMSMNMSNSVASATGGLVRGLQGGQSSFTLSAGLMSGAVDVANQGVQAAAGGLQGLGQIAAGSTKPALKFLGIAAQVAGVGLSMIGNQASRLAKFGIEVLSKELEKTIGAYQRTSASGALFADGLQGMRNAAGDAGLTVDQFSNVVGRNSETLASSGLGVGEASRRMGQVGKVLKEQGIDKKLLSLGYSFEEQAELSAEVMADMRRSNSAALLDPSKIAKTTEEYATNLRVIAAITGEDAKKKMAEARQLSAQAAMRSVISELAQTQDNILTEFNTAVGVMPKELQTAVTQMMTLGAVTDPVAAQLMALSPAFANMVQGTTEQLKSGNFSAEENRKLLAAGADDFRANMNKSGTLFDIGIAGMAEKLPGLNNAITNLNLFTDKMSEQAVKDSQTRTEGQRETNDKLTKSYLDAAVEAQKLAIKLQTLFDPFIESYATVTKKMLEEINKTFDEIRAEIKNGEEGRKKETGWETAKRVGGAALESASTVAGIASLPVMAASSTGVGAAPAALIATGATIAAGIYGGLKEWLSGNTARNAEGGLATTGKLNIFGEKGPEAAVPLPDGRTIPVTIQTPVTAAMVPPEPVPTFATQRLELTGIDNIENMARSFVERPTGRLDAGFSQFLADLKTTSDTTNVVPAPQPVTPTPTEATVAETLKETIEKSNAVLGDLMREHTSLMKESVAKFNDLLSVSNDTRNINQQLLNNSY